MDKDFDMTFLIIAGILLLVGSIIIGCNVHQAETNRHTEAMYQLEHGMKPQPAEKTQ